jgi:hypothetical protein
MVVIAIVNLLASLLKYSDIQLLFVNREVTSYPNFTNVQVYGTKLLPSVLNLMSDVSWEIRDTSLEFIAKWIETVKKV